MSANGRMQKGILSWVLPSAFLIPGTAAIAQVIPDQTFPPGRQSQVTPGPNFQITGGITQGNNLFHSFQTFSVPANGSAFFNNAANITNIISRVTGGSISTINGGLQANSTANLFLINPNGIILGPNASLNIGGSFVATTASGIQFGSQGRFNTSNPTEPGLLTVNPSALLFNQINAQPIRSQANLQVTPGQSLILAGNSITLNGGALLAPAGRVELAGIAGSGSVGINAGNGLSVSIPPGIALADITLQNGAQVNVRSQGGGSIAITAQNLSLTNGSILRAGINAQSGSPGSQAGDIEVQARGAVTLTDGSFIANSMLGTGNSGNVAVQAESVTLLNGSQINSSTFSNGNGGKVTIRASGAVIFDGQDSTGSSAGTYSRVNQGAVGNSGGIQIEAASVSVKNGALITADTFGSGNAGSITIAARDTVQFAGVGAIDQFASGAYSGVRENAIGNSSGIQIRARSLAVENGAQLDASTYGFGNSGKITIQTQGLVKLGGILPPGVDDTGGIYSFVGEQGIGNSGGILVDAGALTIVEGAGIVATTFGRGNAGDVTVRTTGPILLDGQSPVFSTGIFSSVGGTGSGNGGKIQLSAESLTMTNGSAIAASTLGQGNAASITIDVSGRVLLDGVGRDGFPSGVFSRVSRATSRGNSGDINITAGSLFLTRGGQLQASTRGQGNAGNIRIQVADTVQLVGVDAGTGLASGFFSTTSPQSTGTGGAITVQTRNLDLSQGGTISTASQGKGRSGNITLTVRNQLTATDGQISTASSQSTGGSITVVAQDIRLSRSSAITTSVFSGEGGGGNISLRGSRSIIALDDSDILAFSRDGRGGNITLSTPVFFGFRYQPAPFGTDPATLRGNGRVDINASGRLSTGVIALPELSELQNAGVELPTGLVDVSSLIASSCIVKQPRQGSLIVTGAGGLPTLPDDLASAAFPTYNLAPLPANSATSGKTGPLVEIDGIYQLSSGETVLGRSCW